jgi:hypothetical protein
MAQLWYQPRDLEHLDGAELVEVQDDGVIFVATTDECHDTIVAVVGVLLRAFVAIDSETVHVLTLRMGCDTHAAAEVTLPSLV